MKKVTIYGYAYHLEHLRNVMPSHQVCGHCKSEQKRLAKIYKGKLRMLEYHGVTNAPMLTALQGGAKQ
jgi:hypothetical protein